jgi:hypothetical protein
MKLLSPKYLLSVSVLLFAVSLTQFAFYVNTKDAWSDRAFFPFLIGWLGVIDGEFSWFANPLLVVSWVAASLGKKTLALASVICAICFAASFMLRDHLIASEAPTYAKITGYGPGYWLWLASMALSFWCASVTPRKIKPPPQALERPRFVRGS